MTFNKGEVFSLSGQGAETTELKPVVCLVCGRASNTGHHYGVTACLGCKTFFRRVVLQGSSPKCKFQNKCLLVKGSHAKRICRSCRFMKCKDIGMREQALHPCRDLIGRRQPSQSESISPSDSPSSSSSYGGVRHLLRRFCLMFVTLEHGLFTTQMPEHENVWFLSDRTCLIRDFHHLPQEIKRSLTPKITMEQHLDLKKSQPLKCSCL
uniref:Nuclear receptor domain-containing protein n=1 Tax=Heterorhabditis bacteriophora TaxID=37862 RepID=A0A1I7XRC0_HETBA